MNSNSRASRKWEKAHPEYARKMCREFGQKRRKWLSSYKESLGCYVCQEKDPRCLDFHHRDPAQKKELVSQLVTKSMDRLSQEIEKCDVICANCHRKLTIKRQDASHTKG